jgi:hypothetical protein
MSKVDLKLDWCSHAAAKYACENWHYSRCIPKSKLVKIGVWEKGVFIGCVIFGHGATSSLVKRYGLNMFQGCELVRVALTSHTTPVSKIISVCLKFLKRNYSGLRLVVSFADTEQGHNGGIYQAGNWIYTGMTSCSDEYIYKGKRWQGRAFRNKYKGLEHSPFVQIVKGSVKHRYLYPLDDVMRKQIEPLRKPYPKRVSSETSDTLGVQPGEGGATPTDTLHLQGMACG